MAALDRLKASATARRERLAVMRKRIAAVSPLKRAMVEADQLGGVVLAMVDAVEAMASEADEMQQFINDEVI